MMLNESPVPMFLYALPSHHIEISSDIYIYIYDISPHILDTTGTLPLSASNFKMICVINLIVEADRFNWITVGRQLFEMTCQNTST